MWLAVIVSGLVGLAVGILVSMLILAAYMHNR
jgi:hypothetical protein